MFGIFKKPEPCQIVYVVASRQEFRNWIKSQPSGVRYKNIHNEACAQGLVPRCPPDRFVLLPSADYCVQLYLHTHGFPVDKPKPQESERDKSIREWKEKLAKAHQKLTGYPPELPERERIRKWHWEMYFRYQKEGHPARAQYHRNLAMSVESKSKGQLNVIKVARKQLEEDIKLMEVLDQLPCAEQKP